MYAFVNPKGKMRRKLTNYPNITAHGKRLRTCQLHGKRKYYYAQKCKKTRHGMAHKLENVNNYSHIM